MAKSLQAWKEQVYNRPIDLDNGSKDCVDVSKSWIQYLTDVNWTKSAGWGNAKDIYYQWYATYLTRVPRGNAPKLGDIVCMDGTVGGGFGHTGVVVGVSGSNITIYQQDTFTQQPVFTGVYNAHSSYVIGFLRPNANAPFTVEKQTTLLGYQRVASYAANYRDAPDANAKVLQTFVAGNVYDFKGYVHGESIDNNDVWFVGRHTGGYAWSGAFDDKGTHDLPNLTPEPQEALLGYQRKVGDSVINYRRLPEIQPDNVIKTFNPGDVLDLDAYTEGATVDGSNIWFRGKHTKGWSHSGGFTDTGTHDLQKVSLEVIPVPVPTPTDPVDVSRFVVDLSSHNRIVDYQKLKSSVRGVIMRAGHTGKSYGGIQPYNSDPIFAPSKAQLGEKMIGAYWYGYCSLDPETEAGAFVATVGTVHDKFSYWLDIEETSGKSIQEINAWVQAFCGTVDMLTNKVCGIYMNRNWYDTIIDAKSKGNRPMWIAHYGVSENTNMVPNQVAHQFTSKGAVPGVEGNVDVNAVTEALFTPTVIVPPAPYVPTPVEPTPVEPIPVPPAPYVPTPVEPAPFEPAPPSPNKPHTDPVTQLFDFFSNIINAIFGKFQSKK